tara:strand:+ start:113 stop:364 length:252 start_codon:yes stop_codon:yes gene_type:complete
MVAFESMFAMMTVGPWLYLILFWTLFWKGFSLWHSSRNGQRNWFVVILILNTLGILEIIYLFFFRKDRAKKNIFGKKISKKKK